MRHDTGSGSIYGLRMSKTDQDIEKRKRATLKRFVELQRRGLAKLERIPGTDMLKLSSIVDLDDLLPPSSSQH